MSDHPEDAASLEAADEKYVMRPWTHPKGEPVIVAKARGCTVTDVHGKEFLDLTAGYFVNNAGHCHPRIVEAAQKQLGEVLQVSGKHGTPAAIRLAKRMIELAPKSVHKVFFSTGGSEANEFALKAARQFTKKTDIAYLENGYHGLTLGSHILKKIKPVHRLHSRSTEQAAFVVLKSPSIPSVLVETSFITNPEEERLLGTTAFRQKIANAIASGIISYFNWFDNQKAHSRKR